MYAVDGCESDMRVKVYIVCGYCQQGAVAFELADNRIDFDMHSEYIRDFMLTHLFERLDKVGSFTLELASEYFSFEVRT